MNSEYYGVHILPAQGMEYGIALYLAENMRDADWKELDAQGYTPFKGVYESLTSSIEAYIAVYDFRILCAFGIAKAGEETSVWMLAAKNVDKHHKALAKCGMDYIHDKLKTHHTLTNYISKDNERALRYIKHAGATFDNPITLNGTQFVKFTIKE